jgi:hypothetical protein
MKFYYLIGSVLFILLFIGCDNEEDENDTLKPVIDMSMAEASPTPCDTVFSGQDMVFRAVFTDNVELGSYNLELHHNFDHHTHGSHSDPCPMDPDSDPVNPFYFNESFSIPAGSTEYEANVTIAIPAGVDTGDYHFMVKVTDAEGWQSWQSVSLKIL